MPEAAISELIALSRAAQDWLAAIEGAQHDAPLSREHAALAAHTEAAAKELERLVQGAHVDGDDDLVRALDPAKLVALCSACKSVRSTAGAWVALELFLQREHDRWVTHSICPDCFDQLYPEYGRRKESPPPHR